MPVIFASRLLSTSSAPGNSSSAGTRAAFSPSTDAAPARATDRSRVRRTGDEELARHEALLERGFDNVLAYTYEEPETLRADCASAGG